MRNSQAQASRDFAIRQGAMRNLYGEGTGSLIDERRSDPFQGVPRVRVLLNPATKHSPEGYSGTSGAYVVIIKNLIDVAESHAVMEFNLEVTQPPAVAVLSPAFALDKVRAVFGLNISEIAEVFSITRQTVYQWMKFTDMEQVRSHENRERIKQVNAATQLWQSFPPLKGRWLYALLPSDNTVLDLLKANPIDHDALQNAYHALTASTLDRQIEEGRRATQAVTALSNAFAGLGAGRKNRKGSN